MGLYKTLFRHKHKTGVTCPRFHAYAWIVGLAGPIDQSGHLAGCRIRIVRNDIQTIDAARRIGVCHAFGNPHRVTRAMLARKDAYRSEEHTSELQSLMRISYADFCLEKKKSTTRQR